LRLAGDAPVAATADGLCARGAGADPQTCAMAAAMSAAESWLATLIPSDAWRGCVGIVTNDASDLARRQRQLSRPEHDIASWPVHSTTRRCFLCPLKPGQGHQHWLPADQPCSGRRWPTARSRLDHVLTNIWAKWHRHRYSTERGIGPCRDWRDGGHVPSQTPASVARSQVCTADARMHAQNLPLKMER